MAAWPPSFMAFRHGFSTITTCSNLGEYDIYLSWLGNHYSIAVAECSVCVECTYVQSVES